MKLWKTILAGCMMAGLQVDVGMSGVAPCAGVTTMEACYSMPTFEKCRWVGPEEGGSCSVDPCRNIFKQGTCNQTNNSDGPPCVWSYSASSTLNNSGLCITMNPYPCAKASSIEACYSTAVPDYCGWVGPERGGACTADPCAKALVPSCSSSTQQCVYSDKFKTCIAPIFSVSKEGFYATKCRKETPKMQTTIINGKKKNTEVGKTIAELTESECNQQFGCVFHPDTKKCQFDCTLMKTKDSCEGTVRRIIVGSREDTIQKCAWSSNRCS